MLNSAHTTRQFKQVEDYQLYKDGFLNVSEAPKDFNFLTCTIDKKNPNPEKLDNHIIIAEI